MPKAGFPPCARFYRLPIHSQHSLDALAGARLLKRLVDLLKRIELNQLIKREHALLVIIKQLRNEQLRNRVAFHDTDQALCIAHQLGLNVKGYVTGRSQNNSGAHKAAGCQRLLDEIRYA